MWALSELVLRSPSSATSMDRPPILKKASSSWRSSGCFLAPERSLDTSCMDFVIAYRSSSRACQGQSQTFYTPLSESRPQSSNRIDVIILMACGLAPLGKGSYTLKLIKV